MIYISWKIFSFLWNKMKEKIFLKQFSKYLKNIFIKNVRISGRFHSFLKKIFIKWKKLHLDIARKPAEFGRISWFVNTNFKAITGKARLFSCNYFNFFRKNISALAKFQHNIYTKKSERRTICREHYFYAGWQLSSCLRRRPWKDMQNGKKKKRKKYAKHLPAGWKI